MSFAHQAMTLAVLSWRVLDRFHIGGSFAISPHGLGIAMGFLAGAWIFMYEAPKRGDQFLNVGMVVAGNSGLGA